MKKKLLPIFLISLFGMVATGCGGGGEPTPEYTISITNKEALKNNLLVDGHVKVELSITPAGNITSLINSGEITLTSSKTDVATVSGANLYGLKEGTSTLTVKYKTASDSVDVTVRVKTAKDLYGAKHAGTLADPLNNEDAILVAKHKDYAGQDYYVKGVVQRFYATPGSRTDGKVSWYLAPAEEGGEQFEVYNCLKEDGTGLTDDEIWVNGTAVAHGKFTVYNSTQAETDGAVYVSCEGNKPAPKQTIEKTFDEVLALGKELADGDSTYDLYKFDAYVVKKDGSNYYVNKDKTVPADLKDTFELYSAAAHESKLLEGAKVNITCQVKNYHGQIENNGAMTIEVLEEGKAWPINYIKVTTTKAVEETAKLADGAKSTSYYAVSGLVKEITSEYSEQYKNISFTMVDEEGSDHVLTVFRAKLAEGVLPTDIVVGASVIAKGQLQKYVKDDEVTPELVSGTIELPEPVVPGTIEVDVFATNFTADPDNANIATYTSGAVTLTLDKHESTTANRLSDAGHLRIYKNAKFTMSLSSGSFASVAVTFDGSYSAALQASTFEGATYGEGDVLTATAGATSISFVASAQIRISKLVITLSDLA